VNERDPGSPGSGSAGGSAASGLDAARTRLARIASDFQSRVGRPPRIALVGMPGCGKSRLFNRLVGADVSPVSGQGYTTQRAVTATVEGATLVDTPSLRSAEEAETAMAAEIAEADVVLHLVNATGRLSDRDLDLIDQVVARKKVVVVAMNKSDVLTPRELGDVLDSARIFLEDLAIDPLPISAKVGVGVDRLLDRVADRLERYDPPRPAAPGEAGAAGTAARDGGGRAGRVTLPLALYATGAGVAVVLVHRASLPIPMLDVVAVGLAQYLMLGHIGWVHGQTGPLFQTVRAGATAAGAAGYFMLCGKFRYIFPTLGIILDAAFAFATTLAVGIAVTAALTAVERVLPPWVRRAIESALGEGK
jgi:small GTP-binding protein